MQLISPCVRIARIGPVVLDDVWRDVRLTPGDSLLLE
jgi:hypothetical protein